MGLVTKRKLFRSRKWRWLVFWTVAPCCLTFQGRLLQKLQASGILVYRTSAGSFITDWKLLTAVQGLLMKTEIQTPLHWIEPLSSNSELGNQWGVSSYGRTVEPTQCYWTELRYSFSLNTHLLEQSASTWRSQETCCSDCTEAIQNIKGKSEGGEERTETGKRVKRKKPTKRTCSIEPHELTKEGRCKKGRMGYL